MRETLDLGEIAEKPARQIDQMRPLVDQLAAARLGRIGAPFAVVADPPAMAVARAQEHQRAERAGGHEVVRLLQGAVVAMIEADPHETAIGGSRFGEARKLGGAARRRLFDQDMLAGRHGAVGDFGKRVVQGRDDDDGDGGIADSQLPVRHRLAARHRGRQLIGAILRNVGADDETRAAERLRALLADQAATDNRYTRFTAHRSPHCLFRSRPVIRRNV